MPKNRVWMFILCLALVGLLILPALVSATDETLPPKSENLDYGEGDRPPTVEPPADARGTHGCIVICKYPNGPCGWAKASGYDSTSQACNSARRYASMVCRNHGKTPVTGCFIYKSW